MPSAVTEHVTIERSTLIEYHVTRKALRREHEQSYTNVIVQLEGMSARGLVRGYGECHLRRSTGDDPVRSWSFLQNSLEALHGLKIEFGDHSRVVAQVSHAMAGLSRSTVGTMSPRSVSASFRGSTYGLETALLDLVGRAAKTPLADLLSAQRTDVFVAPPSVSLDADIDDLRRRYKQRLRWPVVRFNLTGDVDRDLRVMNELAAAEPSAASWWLAGRVASTIDEAEALVAGLVKGMRRLLPPVIIVEQPLAASRRREMAELQRLADRLTRRAFRRNLDLRIMADESLRTADDLDTLADGGCRAFNVHPARIGGLLPALELVDRALQARPDATIALSGGAGGSDISTWATAHLAHAVPRLDYFALIPGSEAEGLAGEKPSFDVGERILERSERPGLGIEFQRERLIPCSGRYARHPAADGPVLGGRRGRSYPEEHPTRLMGKAAMRSHLVEREAIAHRMATARYTRTTFVARGDTGPSMIFGTSARSPVSGAGTFVIADKHKGAAQALLERAGAPLPEGRIFGSRDLEDAVAYANRLGYPVVSKPVGGTGGAAVTTGVANDEQLAQGFQVVLQSPRYRNHDVLVQRHVPGDVYRIMVLDGEVIAALMRLPPSVTGDGTRSIAELIIEKNSFRLANPRLRKGLIDAQQSAKYLQSKGLDIDSIPTKSESVALADQAYLNSGGDSIDILDELHPSIAEAMILAVQAIPDLRFCGVDVLLEDHRKSVEDQSVGICELNSCPELITPQFPLFGEPRPVARKLLRLAADQRGVVLPAAPSSEVSVRISVDGVAAESGYIEWFSALARELEISGWVASAGSDSVEAMASGSIVPVSVLVSASIVGPSGARPMFVKTRPSDFSGYEVFAVLESVPAGMHDVG